MEAQRLDRMTSTVFNADNLVQLREGVDELLSIFHDIVGRKIHKGEVVTNKDILDKLSQVDRTEWDQIRMKFLQDPYHGYADGDFTQAEENDPAKLILDLVEQVDIMKTAIQKQIEEYYNSDKEFNQHTGELKEQLSESQSALMDVKFRHNQDMKELNMIRSNISHLEGVIAEKNERICELQRENTVQLWEKERARVLEKAMLREAELQKKIEDLEMEKKVLIKKMTTMEEEHKKTKIKTELQLKNNPGANAKELDKVKQHSYMMDKDLHALDSELFQQQKYAIGLLSGLQQDFRELMGRLQRLAEAEKDTSLQKQVDKYRQMLHMCHEAACEGKFSILRADLPDHYLATDREVKNRPTRKLSMAYGARLTPIGSKTPSQNGSQHYESSQGTTDPGRAPPVQESPPDHPELVNPRTNHVNMIVVLRHFPHLTKEYIAEQWEQFCRYDTNGDRSLDLSEMMSAMTSTMGQQFSAAQVREALMEVDKDGSQTIDFYEYIMVSEVILRRTGQSELFRSGLVQSNSKSVSKTCVLQ